MSRSRLSEDLCVDSLAAPGALVREEFDIALPEEAADVRTYDMVTLVQDRAVIRQLAAD